ncbi:MAG TPA: hypothetical protein VGL84_06710 [Gaiellaceae bacterium]|jgi:hypothetical protein
MTEPAELWIPLVDEPIGSIVEEIRESHPEIDELVVGARRTLAFRTFAYIRVGMLLGQLLVEHDVPSDGTWVETLFADPAVKAAIVSAVIAVAHEVANDDTIEDDVPLGPDEAARERFRDFARKQLH